MDAQKQAQQLRDALRIIESEYLVTSPQQKWFQDKHLKDHQESNREDDRSTRLVCVTHIINI